MSYGCLLYIEESLKFCIYTELFEKPDEEADILQIIQKNCDVWIYRILQFVFLYNNKNIVKHGKLNKFNRSRYMD